MTPLGPAGYIDDDGNLHFDTAALCRLAGEEPTPENQQWWIDEIVRQFRENMPGVPIMVREDDIPNPKYVPFNPKKHIRHRSEN